MQRVWFNHWFSTAYNLIDNITLEDLIKKYNDDFVLDYII